MLGGAASKAGARAAFEELKVRSSHSIVQLNPLKNGSGRKKEIVVRRIHLMDGNIVSTVEFVHGLIMPDYRYPGVIAPIEFGNEWDQSSM